MARSAQPVLLAAPEPHETNYFIRAGASLAERRYRILKHGDTFGMFDHHGDIIPSGDDAPGLYHGDMRHLSGLQLLVAGRHPLLLSSNVLLDNAALKVDLANPDILDGESRLLPRDVLHLGRTRFLWQRRLYERLAVRNHGDEAIEVDLDLVFAADFADIFEARGLSRTERGELRSETTGRRVVRFSYMGLDGRERSTSLSFDPAPGELSDERARFRLALRPGQQATLFFTVDCNVPPAPKVRTLGFFHGLKKARRPTREAGRRSAAVETSNAVVNEILCRSVADLNMLMTETPHGSYPYAGVPWFSTAFGRDGLITALFLLWAQPDVARGVLDFLAATQADAEDAEADAEPGKILHETRDGELAHLGVVPFRRYYGSIDATPLFVVLAGAYYQRTGDLASIRRLEPNIRRALDWIERYGDRDGDGLVEYERRTEKGLVNQGWKDSHDSVFDGAGRFVRGPIALVEVQGYVFAAFKAAALIARALGREHEAAQREQQAERIRDAVEEHFWRDDIGFYAMALDGAKRACRVRASNAGQLLFTGLPRHDRAVRVADALLSPQFYSGFGIRTLAEDQPRYNPMSYHNGSVWPHDNALIALGLARYGLKEAALTVLDGLLDAATFMDLRRLPELFCGFRRRRAVGPTLYPVACSPQAWASAAPMALLQAALGLGFDPQNNAILFDWPRLPQSLDEVRLRNLRLGDGAVDLLLRRAGDDVAVNVTRREEDVEVVLRV